MQNTALRVLFVVVLVFSFTGVVSAASFSPDSGDTNPVEPRPRDDLAATAFPPVTVPDPVIRWMVDQVEQDTVRQYDGDLSGEWPVVVNGKTVQIKTRNTNSGTPIDNATKYVGEHMTNLGLSVEYHRWGPSTAPNVIGQKTGASRPGDIYMVTAHLDDMPSGSTAPGADDNASGSTAVLVAADILSQFSWDCTLRFALWTGEEQGLLGSDKYAQRAYNNDENILGVLNLDMIAWNTPDSLPEIDLHADGDLPRTVDLANQAASVMTTYAINLAPEVRADGTGASDHASFWKYGYDAILGIEDYYPNDHDFDPYYHTTGDKLDTLDLGYFTEYVKAAVAETATMAGCLLTGALQGQVTASHDGSPIANAALSLTDTLGRVYQLTVDTNGEYRQAVPPSTYAAQVSAYGYAATETNGIIVSANGSTTQNFVLAAAAAVAPTASIGIDAGEARLTWPHVSPDTNYQVHRSQNPYFTPQPGTRLSTLEANHPPAANESLTYRDADSAVGDAGVNHFYLILGVNAAGASAGSNHTGEFDFALVAGSGL